MIRIDRAAPSLPGLLRGAGFLPMLLLGASGLHAQTSPGDLDWADLSPHEVRSIPVAPDVELEVLDWGGPGIPVVFLAGATFNAHIYDDFAPRFTYRHQVIGASDGQVPAAGDTFSGPHEEEQP